MFNKIVFSNYYLRKRRDLKKDGKASNLSFDPKFLLLNYGFSLNILGSAFFEI